MNFPIFRILSINCDNKSMLTLKRRGDSFTVDANATVTAVKCTYLKGNKKMERKYELYDIEASKALGLPIVRRLTMKDPEEHDPYYFKKGYLSNAPIDENDDVHFSVPKSNSKLREILGVVGSKTKFTVPRSDLDASIFDYETMDENQMAAYISGLITNRVSIKRRSSWSGGGVLISYPKYRENSDINTYNDFIDQFKNFFTNSVQKNYINVQKPREFEKLIEKVGILDNKKKDQLFNCYYSKAYSIISIS